MTSRRILGTLFTLFLTVETSAWSESKIQNLSIPNHFIVAERDYLALSSQERAFRGSGLNPGATIRNRADMICAKELGTGFRLENYETAESNEEKEPFSILHNFREWIQPQSLSRPWKLISSNYKKWTVGPVARDLISIGVMAAFYYCRKPALSNPSVPGESEFESIWQMSSENPMTIPTLESKTFKQALSKTFSLLRPVASCMSLIKSLSQMKDVDYSAMDETSLNLLLALPPDLKRVELQGDPIPHLVFSRIACHPVRTQE